MEARCRGIVSEGKSLTKCPLPTRPGRLRVQRGGRCTAAPRPEDRGSRPAADRLSHPRTQETTTTLPPRPVASLLNSPHDHQRFLRSGARQAPPPAPRPGVRPRLGGILARLPWLAGLCTLAAAAEPPPPTLPPPAAAPAAPAAPGPSVLRPDTFHALVGDDAAWVLENAPLFECPDPDLQQIYYFRWHVYHEHLKQTPAGWVVTEFLPDVPWAGKYNTISCAAGHHIYEGRWLRDRRYMEDYCRFWFRERAASRGGTASGPPTRSTPLPRHRRQCRWPSTCCRTWSRTTTRGRRPTATHNGPVLADRRPRRHGILHRRQRLPPHDQLLPVRRRRRHRRRSPSSAGKPEVAADFRDQGGRSSRRWCSRSCGTRRRSSSRPLPRGEGR